MDWKRAISILVASFIALNIFLAINLYRQGKSADEFSLTPGQQEEIKKFLREKGVDQGLKV